MQRHGLHAALDEAINVEIASGDGDPALSQNLRVVRVDRRVEVGQCGRVNRVGRPGLKYRSRPGIEDGDPQCVVIDVLPRVSVGVEPVLGVQREIGSGLDVHRLRANLARHRDAAVEVPNRGAARFVDEIADQVESQIDIGNGEGVPRQRTERLLSDRDRR